MDNITTSPTVDLMRILNSETKHSLEWIQIDTYLAQMVLDGSLVYILNNNVGGGAPYYDCIEDNGEIYLSIFLTPESASKEMKGCVHSTSMGILLLEVLTTPKIAGIYIQRNNGTGLILDCYDFSNIFKLLIVEKRQVLNEQAREST